MSDFVIVHKADGQHQVPKSNLQEVMRLDGKKIISITDPSIIAPSIIPPTIEPEANMDMLKKELQKLADSKGLTYDPIDNKTKLVNLINS